MGGARPRCNSCSDLNASFGKQLTVRKPRISFVLGLFIDRHQSEKVVSFLTRVCVLAINNCLKLVSWSAWVWFDLWFCWPNDNLYILRSVLHYCKYKILYYCVDNFCIPSLAVRSVSYSSMEYYCCVLKWKLGIVLKGFITTCMIVRWWTMTFTMHMILCHPGNVNYTVHDTVYCA